MRVSALNPTLRTLKAFLVIIMAAFALVAAAHAASGPKTSDINEEISPNGAVDLAFKMTFDAAPWRQWKAMVGDEPARLRAMMRHEFAAYTLDDFKLDRDDLNRVAKLTIHSPTGPELRDDGSYQVPVESYFRLINHAGQDWYFSGNNPRAGYSLNSVHITLPANAVNAYVANGNSSDQALIFALVPPPSPLRWYYLAGSVLLVLGLLLLVLGLLKRQRLELMAPAVPRALPVSGSTAAYSPAAAEPMPARATVVEPTPIVSPPAEAKVIEPTPQPPGKSYVEPD